MAKVKLINDDNQIDNENEVVTDFQPIIDDVEFAKFKEMQKKYEKLVNSNTLLLSAELKTKEVKQGSEVKDKKTGQPIVDDMGQVKYYPDTYILGFIFKGGFIEYKCSLEMYKSLEVNKTYLLKGYIGVIKEYGKDVISPIFQAWQEV